MKRKIKYDNDWPIVAICYDFDKTLSPKDMQEFSLIPKIGLDAKTFWAESNHFAKKEGMDKMLSYMKLILERAKSTNLSLALKDFKAMGKNVELFEGVEGWFDRINKYGKVAQVNIEHYIISAGLKEILEGTTIAKYFTEIYASSFIYSQYGEPIWPRQVVNYTTKTQYLFRINKHCLDLTDEESVNEYVEAEERRIPFTNFIYIGDSVTDIPAMRVVKREKGHSIGVYNPTEKNIQKVHDLIWQERINYYAPANYTENSPLDKIVKNVILQIKKNHEFVVQKTKMEFENEMQKDLAYDYERTKDFCEYAKARIESDEIDEHEESYIFETLDFNRKRIAKEYVGKLAVEIVEDCLANIDSLKKDLKKSIKLQTRQNKINS